MANNKERFSLYLPQILIARIDAIADEMRKGISNPSRSEIATAVIEQGLPLIEQSLAPTLSTEPTTSS